MRRSLVLAALLAAFGLVVGLSIPAAQAEPSAPSVAVVDVLRCIRAHPAYTKSYETFLARGKAATDEQERGIAEGREMLKQLELEQVKDSPQYVEKQKMVEVKRNTIKFQFEWSQKVAQDELMRAWAGVYEQVKGYIGAYARTNHIPLVLQMTEERLQAKSPEEFTANLVVRGVPYFQPDLNITDAVIATIPGAVKPTAPPPAPALVPGPGPLPAPAPAPGPAPLPPAMSK